MSMSRVLGELKALSTRLGTTSTGTTRVKIKMIITYGLNVDSPARIASLDRWAESGEAGGVESILDLGIFLYPLIKPLRDFI